MYISMYVCMYVYIPNNIYKLNVSLFFSNRVGEKNTPGHNEVWNCTVYIQSMYPQRVNV